MSGIYSERLSQLRLPASSNGCAPHPLPPGAQATLTSEMGGLRSELADVKARIRAQLEANGEAIASLHARGDLATRAGLEEAAVAAAAAEGAKARG